MDCRVLPPRPSRKEPVGQLERWQLSLTLANLGSPRESGILQGKWIRREFCHCLGLAGTVKKLTRPIFDASKDAPCEAFPGFSLSQEMNPFKSFAGIAFFASRRNGDHSWMVADQLRSGHRNSPQQ
jgi:hypothetical protein